MQKKKFNNKGETRLKNKTLFLLDMDGTLYLGNKLFRGTKEFLAYLKSNSIDYVYMTNNSSKGVESYMDKMKKMGIETCQNQFITSVDTTIEFFKKNYGREIYEKGIYVLGTQSLKKQLRDEKLKILDWNDFTEFEKDFINNNKSPVDILLLGYDTELNYEKLKIASLLLALKEKENYAVDYVATNPDWVCPTEKGFVPDCGSMAQMLEHAVHRLPYFIGKPEPHIVNLALERFKKDKEAAVIIGDRLYTDILCGKKSGIDSIFLLSGEGTLEDLKESEARPTWIMENIEEVYENIKNKID